MSLIAEPQVLLQVNIDVELISIDPVAGTLVLDVDPFFYDPDVAAGRPKDCATRTFDIFTDEYVSPYGAVCEPLIYCCVQESLYKSPRCWWHA